MKRSLIFILLSVFTIFGVNAKVTLPVIISDGMVLQRDHSVKIWGFASPDEKIKITFQKEKYKTQADANGNWQVMLPKMEPGGPYEMTINDITVKDILIGDVFLCSGQSNMELPVRRVMDMFADEINKDENTQIRHLKVPRATDFHSPKNNMLPSQWKSLNPQNALDFSAVAYFFAKELYSKTHVPVGIINASVGGSPVEAWISEDAVKPLSQYDAMLKMCKDDDYVTAIKDLDSKRNRLWDEILYKTPIDKNTPWHPMSLFSAAWSTDGLNPVNGLHFFHRTVNLSASQINGNATLRLGCIVDADSVFVNGTFVGTTSYQYPPRIYEVPKNILKVGENTIDIHLVSYTGMPCFVPEKPYKLITSDGEISLHDGWQYKLGVRMPAKQGDTFIFYNPTGLYNGMIAPNLNFTTCGVIWYQGESNVSRYNQYSLLLETLIVDWRKNMQQSDLPFYIIELAGFLHPQDSGQKDWAALREAQKSVADSGKNVYLIQNRDLGEWNDIHPLDKKTLAKRIVEEMIKK